DPEHPLGSAAPRVSGPQRGAGDAEEARQQTMDWADELAASVEGPQVVNDSKTPSGTVHVGSLRGPVTVDVIWRAVRKRGLEAHFLYGVEDLDAMDNQSLLAGDAVERYMGV